jgi:multidrug efflux pump subunit AcrB
MDEVGTALIAIALVLLAGVRAPTAFIGGITGMFLPSIRDHDRDGTAISLFISLTLSPALCALLSGPCA